MAKKPNPYRVPGYAAFMYDSVQFCTTVKRIAAALPDLMEDAAADFIAVTGKSGIAVAFALHLLVPNLNIVVVRKGEFTHGAEIEGSTGNGTRYLFLDDLIDSGSTIRRVLATLNREGMECAGAVVYAHGAGSSYREHLMPAHSEIKTVITVYRV